MSAQFDRLFDALAEAHQPPPADLLASLRGLPPPGDLPSPWETWTLIGLVRHRERQLWVGEIVKTRLGGNLADLARRGACGGHPDRPPLGTVPGLPEWEYRFHGIGCCITHKVTDESIDVDFFEESAEYFDTYFYRWYLESLRQPEPAESRLLELHRSVSALDISIASLVDSEMLAPLPGRDSHHFRISDRVLDHADKIDAFTTAWADPSRQPWLAALIGDWPAVHDALDRSDQAPVQIVSSERAAKCRELRRTILASALRNDGTADQALWGLADIGPTVMAPALAEALNGPLTGRTTSAALDIIEKLADPTWGPQLHALFHRLRPDGPDRQPHLWMKCVSLLLRFGYAPQELLVPLPSIGCRHVGDAALLALEYAPEMALPLLRRGLVSEVPANRTTVAAILALIDEPWTRAVLLSALESSDDQATTADARAALHESRDEACRQAADAWEQRNPHEPELGSYLEIDGRKIGPFHTFGEISLTDRAEWIHFEMDNLRDRVMRVRHRVPPEPR